MRFSRLQSILRTFRPPEKDKYAKNHSLAESQKDGHEKSESSAPNESTEAPCPNPYAKYHGVDATIWARYMKETQADDKELVQIWKTGLDALLVFAGLFGTILAAFLLESRKGLQDNPQEILLRDISQALRNNSSTPAPLPFYPSIDSLSINALWFISLTLALVSALGGVLAKGWVDAYLPASAGQSFYDACERHLRVIRAHQWRLDLVLAVIPLLLQLSLILFLAGLAPFVLADHKGIGAAVSALIALTSVLYIGVTILPRFSPGCPFQSTLSPLIPGTNEFARYRPNRSTYVLLGPTSTRRNKPQAETLKVMILVWILNSSSVNAIDEAVKAIAGLGPDRTNDLRLAITGYNVLPHLCRRFMEISRLVTSPADHNCDTKEAYLRAMFHVATLPGDDSDLKQLIKRGGVLDRWDTWEQNLQPLAFCLWMTILMAHEIVEPENNWSKVKKNLESMIAFGTFPEVRMQLMDVALRGLMSPTNSRTSFGFGLLLLRLLGRSRNLKMPAIFENSGLDMDTFADNIWDAVCDIDEVLVEAAKEVLMKVELCHEHQVFRKGLKNKRKKVLLEAISMIVRGVDKANMHNTMKSVMSDLLGLLKHEDSCVREAAATAIGEISKQSELAGTLSEGVKPVLLTLLEDECPKVLKAAVSAISEFSKQLGLVKVIDDAVPIVLGFLKHESRDVRGAAESAIHEFSEQPGLTDIIEGTMPLVVDLLGDETQGARMAAVSLIAKFSEQPGLRKAVQGTMSVLLDLLKDRDSTVRGAAVSAIARCSNQPGLLNIDDVMSVALDLLKDGDSGVRRAALSAIIKFSKQSTKFIKAIENAMPVVLGLLKDGPGDAFWAAISMFREFSKQLGLIKVIEGAIPILLKLLNDKSRKVRHAVESLIHNFSKNPGLVKVIEGAMPGLLGLLEDKGSCAPSRRASVSLIAGFSKRPELCKAIEGMPILLGLLKDEDPGVRTTALSAMAVFPKQPGLVKAIEAAMPLILGLLKDEYYSVTEAAVSVIVGFAKQPGFIEAIECAMPLVVDLLKHEDSGIREAAVRAVTEFSKQPGLVKDIETAIPLVLGLLEDKKSDVRKAAVSAIAEFSKQLGLVKAFDGAMPPVQGLLKDRDSGVRQAAVSAITEFSKQPGVVKAMEGVIPTLITLLKDEHWSVHKAAEVAIREISKQPELVMVIEGFTPALLGLLKDEHSNVRQAAISLVAEFLHQGNTIQRTMPLLLDFIKNGDSNVCKAVASVVSGLFKHSELVEHIDSSIIPVLDNALDEEASTYLRHALLGGIHEPATQAFLSTLKPFITQSLKYYRAHRQPTKSGMNGILRLDNRGLPGPPLPSFLHHNLSTQSHSGRHPLKTYLEATRNAAQMVFFGLITNPVGMVKDMEQQRLILLSILSKKKGLHIAIEGTITGTFASLEDTRLYIREAAVATILEFYKQPKLVDTIDGVMPRLLYLLEDKDLDYRMVAISVMREFSKSVTVNIFKAAMPVVLGLLKDPQVQCTAISAIGEVSKRAELVEAIMGTSSVLLALLDDTNMDVRLAAISAIVEFSKQPGLITVIEAAIPVLLDFLKDNDYVAGAVVSAIGQFSKQVGLVKAIEGAVPVVLGSLKTWWLQPTAVLTISQISEQAELVEAIKAAMPLVLSLLKDESHDIPNAAVSIIVEFSKQPGLIEAIECAMPLVVDLLKHEYSGIREAAVRAVTEFSKQPGLVKDIETAIPLVLGLLEDRKSDVRKAAVFAIAEFSKQLGLVKAIDGAMPLVQDLLKDRDSDVRQAAVSVIAECSKQPELVGAIESAIPQLLNFLWDKHSNEDSDVNSDLRMAAVSTISTIRECSMQPRLVKSPDVREAALSVIAKFAQQSELVMVIEAAARPVLLLLLRDEYLEAARSVIRELSKQPGLSKTIEDVMPLVLDSLKDEAAHGRSGALFAIAEFSKQPGLIKGIEGAMPVVFSLLQDQDSSVREAAVSALAEFSKQSGLIKAIEGAMPVVFSLLKDKDSSVREAAVSALAEFSKQPGLIKAIKGAMPVVSSLLKDQDSSVRRHAVSVITRFAKKPELLNAIDSYIHVLLGLLKAEDSYYNRQAIVNIICEILTQQHPSEAIRHHLPDLWSSDVLAKLDSPADNPTHPFSPSSDYSPSNSLAGSIAQAVLSYYAAQRQDHSEDRLSFFLSICRHLRNPNPDIQCSSMDMFTACMYHEPSCEALWEVGSIWALLHELAPERPPEEIIYDMYIFGCLEFS